jgi:multiple sugar transport system permease protein
MLIPITAMAMPLYVMIDGIGLNDTLLGLILASSFFPFGAFLSYLYYTSVLPPDLVGMGELMVWEILESIDILESHFQSLLFQW